MLVSDKSKALEVVKALSDDYSRKIILAIIEESLPIEEISARTNVPISTCYRRMHELFNYGIVRADKTIIQNDGKKFVCYKSSFKNATIHIESGELVVDLVSNRDPSEKLYDIWSSFRSSESPGMSPEVQAKTERPNLLRRQINPLIKVIA